MENKFTKIFKKKWLNSIVLTVLLFAIIICAFLAINYAVEQANIDDIDFTEKKLYSISQATKDKLQNLDQNITISIYNMYDYVKDYAYKYANLNSNITVKELENLNAKTDWKTNYGVTDTDSFIVVESSNREKILYNSNLYTYDYTTYEEIDITEEAITNAILDVITNIKPKICFLTGHNLYSNSYFQYLESSLASEVNQVEYVNLLTAGSVPEDCKLLVITALKEDITQAERDSILKYIQNGGEILLLLDPNLDKIKTPNFQKILDEYGVSNSEGIILEGDSSKMLYGAPNFVIAEINKNSEIVKNIDMGLNVCMMNAGRLSFASSEDLEKKNVTLETLATVSDKAFYRTNLEANSQSKLESDEDAKEAVIAAMLTKKIEDNKTSRMIVFSNTVFATNYEIMINSQYYTYSIAFCNNEDVILNTVSYLTEREDNITIRKDQENVSTSDLSMKQMSTILIIIFVIPVLIIIIGIVVWILRRRKK